MKITKTTFEKEQTEKDEAFLRLSALQRMDQMRKVRDLMRKKASNIPTKAKRLK
jgi:hypothetical protein